MSGARRFRVCHVTTAHARNDPRIFMKECVSLARAGHDVHYVLGDGLGDAVVDGVSVHDVGLKPTSRVQRMWRQTERVADAVRALRPDVMHFHDPECLPFGVSMANAGVRVIFDAHEDVPGQILSKEWIPRGLRRAVSLAFAAYQRRAVRQLAGVVAATPHIHGLFRALGDRAVCVNNYAFPEEMAPLPTSAPRQARVCFAGCISRARGIVHVVRALPLAPDVRLTLCGSIGDAGLEASLRAEPGWGQVDYLGSVDRSVVRRILAESSAGLVTYLPEPNHIDAQPTKVFEYMSAALPVIASHFPLWRRIVEDTGAGLCVDPESPEAIASAIRAIVGDAARVSTMGDAGRTAALTKFNWAAEAATLVAFYERLP